MKQYHAVSKPGSIRLSIPQPCTEDWGKMSPQDKGRFCSSCQKCVIDFTAFSDRAIYEYIQAHKNEEICGNFYTSQLNRPIRIPAQPHSRLYRYFVGLGLTLILSQLPNTNLFAKAPYSYVNKADSCEKHNKITNSSVSGAVADSLGRSVPNARITILANSKVVGDSRTDAKGYYSTGPLKPRRYDIKVSREGYTTVTVTNIIISPEKQTWLEIQLPFAAKGNSKPVSVPYYEPVMYEDIGRLVIVDDADSTSKK